MAQDAPILSGPCQATFAADQAQAVAGDRKGCQQEQGGEADVGPGLPDVVEIAEDAVGGEEQKDHGAVAGDGFLHTLLVADAHANVGETAGRKNGNDDGGEYEEKDDTQHDLLL